MTTTAQNTTRGYCVCGGSGRRAYAVIDRERNFWGCGTCHKPTEPYLRNVIERQVEIRES